MSAEFLFSNDVNRVKTFNISNFTVNKKDQNGRTPLHLACSENRIDEIKYLIELGSDPTIIDNFNLTPLHWCVYFGNFTIIQLLLKKNLQITVKDEDVTHEIHLNVLIEDKKELQQFLIKLTDEVMKYIAQTTPFHYAAYFGNLELITRLLDKEVNVNMPTEKTTTALHLAAFKGHVDITKLLVEKGADLNLVDDSKRLALHWAAISNNIDTIECVLPHVITDDFSEPKINSADLNYNTALYLAIVYSNLDSIKYLLKQNAEIKLESGENWIHLNTTSVKELDQISIEFLENGTTTLATRNWSVAFCSLSIVQKYLHTSNVFEEKNSPLYAAAAFNRKDVLQYLIRNRVDLNAFIVGSYTPPITWAVRTGHKELVKYMIEIGCKYKKEHLGDSYFDSYAFILHFDGKWEFAPLPLHSAAIRGDLELVRILLDLGEDINASWTCNAVDFAVLNGHKDLVEYLLKNGVNTEYLMHKVAEKGDPRQLKMLVDFGIRIDSMMHTRTPLFEACSRGKFENVKFLVENGANVNHIATYPYNMEALHDAIRSNSVAIVEYLIKNGADVNCNSTCSPFPKTPLSEAMKVSRLRRLDYDIFRLLVIYGADLHADVNLFRVYTAACQIRAIDSDIVQLLHLAGLQFDKINLVPDEESIYLPRFFTDIPFGLKQYYLQVNGKPLTLRQLCRIALRHVCRKRYVQMIESEHFPNFVKDYLLLKIVDNEI